MGTFEALFLSKSWSYALRAFAYVRIYCSADSPLDHEVCQVRAECLRVTRESSLFLGPLNGICGSWNKGREEPKSKLEQRDKDALYSDPWLKLNIVQVFSIFRWTITYFCKGSDWLHFNFQIPAPEEKRNKGEIRKGDDISQPWRRDWEPIEQLSL